MREGRRERGNRSRVQKNEEEMESQGVGDGGKEGGRGVQGAKSGS